MLPATPPLDALGHDHDRDLAWRALPLGERLAFSSAVRDQAVPGSNSADKRLDLWCKASAAGDRDAFLRRLAWDDWSPATVAPALDDTLPPNDFELPLWIGTLNEVRRELSHSASKPSSQAGRLPEESLFAVGKVAPFLEVWVPFLRVARRRLRHQAGPAASRLRAEAWGTLERQLLMDLSGLGVQVLFDRFHEHRKATPGPRAPQAHGRHHYSSFVAALLDGGLDEIFQEYSVLARQACTAVEDWVAASAELLHRLDRDAKAIAARFNHGHATGPVRELRLGLSDRHRGGRQVARLTFESGLSLIYKPRSVQLEAAVHGFLAWLQHEGLPCAPPALVFLSPEEHGLCREDYGWVQFARSAAIADADDYLRRAGSLLCIADVLRIDDLHWENLIATQRGPVLVDCEMALQPQPAGALPRSVLSSQLLTALQLDAAGKPYETSGLRGAGGQLQELSRRVWKNVNTDAMGYQVRRPVASPGANVARYQGQQLRPEDRPKAFLEGYETTYRFLLEHQQVFQRREIPQTPSPLAAFEGCATRVLFRPTQVYSVLLSRLGAPSYLRSGALASLLADSLNRVFVGQQERPPLWPLTHDERHALERRDVPTFSVSVAETSLTPSGGTFETSGLRAVEERFASLSEEDLEDQNHLLSRLLTQPPRFLVPPAAFLPAKNADLLQPAEAIGRQVLAQQAPSFHHLYDGSCGTAILLAALAVQLDDGTYRQRALHLLEAFAKDLEEDRLQQEPLGACHGLGGMIYGLVLTGRLLREPRCLAWASATAALITQQRIAADPRLDLEGGAAGAILGLLSLYDANGDATLLPRAEACAEHLLAHPAARSLETAGTGQGIPAGLAHGASGFALALARLAARASSNDARQRYAGSAQRLFAHEERLIASRGWTDGRWCNGAAGMALARLDAVAELGPMDGLETSLEDGLELAVQATVSRLATTRDDLCCGRLGRADAILEIGRQLEDPWLLRTADLATGTVLDDAVLDDAALEDLQRTSSFRLAEDKDPQGGLESQFFSGLSGIAYSLLRRQNPETFPCVLLLRQ